MVKYIPAKKLSKKEQKCLNSIKRGSWHGVDPATRIAETDKRRYKRKPKHPIDYYGLYH